MDNNLNVYAGGKLVSRATIVKAIKESTSKLQLLGTVAFNLPWTEENLFDIVLDKYKAANSHYEIHVISESDPSLQSYSLTSGLGSKGACIPIATLEEIRQNSTLILRQRFQNANLPGIEPVEDHYRRTLDSMYARRFANNICKELFVREHTFEKFFGKADYEQETNVLGLFYSSCLQNAENVFRNSDLAKYYLNKGDYFRIGKQLYTYKERIENALKELLATIDTTPQERKADALFTLCDNVIEVNHVDELSQKRCDFKIASKELQSICVDCFLRILAIYEQNNYELIKEYASKEAYKERMNLQGEIERDVRKKQRLFIKQIFHPIPVQMLMIDGVYYASISPMIKTDKNQFLYIGDSTKDKDEDTDRFSYYEDYVYYFKSYVNSPYCTEETKKRNHTEVIYNYTSNHEIIGQMPRDSFYGSDNYKLVMWALVFDRKGRILIHRRANNAKDNQGLWDKSVGGHIAISDRDTISGAAREIAEELYKVEEEEQSHTQTNMFNHVNSDEIIYLGKWKETRYPNFGSSLNLEPNEFYLFSFESRMTAQPIDSMRILPNGTRIKARCFVDLYFSITSKNFDLTELKNSKYLVLPPQLIKRCAVLKQLTPEIRQEIQYHNPNIDLNDISNHFDVTPDLDFIINSPEWDSEITKFSIRVSEAFAK